MHFELKFENRAVGKGSTIALILIIIVAAFIALYFLDPSTRPGGTDTTLKPATQQAPNATITVADREIGLDQTLTLNASNSTGAISEYKWSIYGDVIGYGETLQHRFENAGVYTVTLQVTDSSGRISTDTVIITVGAPKYSFAEAVANGYIEAKWTGTGSCAGDCIELHVKRLVNYTIEVEPPEPGTELANAGAAQNMVLFGLKGLDEGGGMYTPSLEIELSTTKESVYIFTAYCLNFHEENPESYDTLEPKGPAQADVLKIFNATQNLPYGVADISAVQTAIWVVTDNVTLAELQSTFPDGARQVENARTILNAAGIDISSKALFS